MPRRASMRFSRTSNNFKLASSFYFPLLKGIEGVFFCPFLSICSLGRQRIIRKKKNSSVSIHFIPSPTSSRYEISGKDITRG